MTIWILELRCLLSNIYNNTDCLLRMWIKLRFYIPRVNTDGYQYSNTRENSHARMKMAQTRWIHIHLVLPKWPSSVPGYFSVNDIIILYRVAQTLYIGKSELIIHTWWRIFVVLLNYYTSNTIIYIFITSRSFSIHIYVHIK